MHAMRCDMKSEMYSVYMRLSCKNVITIFTLAKIRVDVYGGGCWVVYGVYGMYVCLFVRSFVIIPWKRFS